jgi:hypothetical protein
MEKMMRVVPLLFLFTLISGCANHLYFGTSTSIGLDVSGTSKIPNKVSFAFSRAEVAIVPDDSEGNAHSVFGSLDSEWTWFNGFIIKQAFATGDAADIIASEPAPAKSLSNQSNNSQTSRKPLLFTTGTKLGIDIEFGQTADAPASLLVGYRRAEMTLMPDVEGEKKLDPVLADISIISEDQSLPNIPDWPQLGGVRMKQRFATGQAAINAAHDGKVREKLRKEVLGGSALSAIQKAKTRFDYEGDILKRFSEMDGVRQKEYLQTLNETFGKAFKNVVTSGNLQTELVNLNDTQIQVAAEQIRSF